MIIKKKNRVGAYKMAKQVFMCDTIIKAKMKTKQRKKRIPIKALLII